MGVALGGSADDPMRSGRPRCNSAPQPMPALHPAPACPAGAKRHLEPTDEHARDRQLFLHVGGHARRLQHPAAVRAGRRQGNVMPFIEPHWRPAARRHTIRGAGSPARPLRRTAERFRKRCRLAATGPTRSVKFPLQPRILSSSSRLCACRTVHRVSDSPLVRDVAAARRGRPRGHPGPVRAHRPTVTGHPIIPTCQSLSSPSDTSRYQPVSTRRRGGAADRSTT